jgi:hypothetical protein
MALDTYGGLKTAIASFLNRTDLTSAIPDFVALAESDIRRDVRMQAMESLATGTLTGETLAFPTRFVEAKRLAIGGDVHEYVTPSRYQELDDAGVEMDVYTIVGETFYILNGASGDSYSLLYMASFAPFSADADANALLANYPDVYLYGALKHASVYMKDDNDVAKFAGAYSAAVGRANMRERAKATTGARLFVRAA